MGPHTKLIRDVFDNEDMYDSWIMREKIQDLFVRLGAPGGLGLNRSEVIRMIYIAGRHRGIDDAKAILKKKGPTNGQTT